MSLRFCTRAFVLVVLFGVAGPSSVARAATAAPPSTSRVEAINQRLAHLESLVASLHGRLLAVAATRQQYLKQIDSRKAALDKERDELAQAEAKTAESQLTLSSQSFQIAAVVFGAVALAASAVIAIGGYLVKLLVTERVTHTVTETATRDAEKKISVAIHDAEAKISRRIDLSVNLAVATGFRQFAIPWWQQYEASYQSFLRKEEQEGTAFSEKISIARGFSEEGLAIFVGSDGLNEILGEVKQLEGKDLNALPDKRLEAMILDTYAALVNHWVYHQTAEWICRGETAPSDDKRFQLLSRAEECLAFSSYYTFHGGYWYELQETAANALIGFGGHGSQERGRTIIRNLFQRATPGIGFAEPPKQWLAELWDEYFPTDAAGETRDRLSLGNIARPSPA